MSHIEAFQFKNRFVSLIIGGQGFPKKHLDRHILFISATLGLEPQRQYIESELNDELRKWTARFGIAVNLDHVSLRRSLVDGGYVRRDSAGEAYELTTTGWPYTLLMLICFALSASCSSSQTGPTPEPNMPNPASVYCEQQGNKLEIVTAADGSQTGVCIFPDGSTCDEWAYFRGECGPAKQSGPPSASTEIPTALPIDPADYQGWWTYTHPVYNFSIILPEDWIVEEVTTSDPLMNGHMLSLHPKYDVEKESIRMTFRRVGEEATLWPTGVGQGEFIPQGTLDVTGQPAQRVLLVCPTGEVTSIWYHQGEGVPNITRGDLEFGFIFSATPFHCEAGYSLNGKVQRMGEMIIASLNVP